MVLRLSTDITSPRHTRLTLHAQTRATNSHESVSLPRSIHSHHCAVFKIHVRIEPRNKPNLDNTKPYGVATRFSCGKRASSICRPTLQAMSIQQNHVDGKRFKQSVSLKICHCASVIDLISCTLSRVMMLYKGCVQTTPSLTWP